MLARIFIDRPVLACVLSVVILLLGGISAGLLPVAEYPEVTPPIVRVSAYYPGANAQVLADTVAAPIEQQVNGVEKMLYMTSQSNNDGSYTLDVTFEIGTNTNMAQVLVQNRVAIAEPSLPDVVRAIGVTTKKRAADILLAISLDSDVNPETRRPYYDALYMSNFATIQLKDAISRLEGVGDVFVMGQQDYSMRVWLDPDKLASRNLTVSEVIKVLREQNVQVAAGQIGQPPASAGQDFQYTLSTLGRLVEPEQFANIVLNTDKKGEITYLRDVSRTDLGARSEDLMARLDRRPSSGLATYLLPGSNALDTADAIKARMRELEPRFPAGLKYAIVYDTTPFVRESVDEVKKTLLDAIILVTIVILVFLQDWKSLLLPVIGVLVSLVGTFAVMLMMGFTLNNLTLFGLVLAIGIVVDDAIVVLENIERWMEKGLPAREATSKAMEEITGPIVAITLVLSSVLLPSAFLSGLVGQFFRQFAITISVSMLISAINAMSVTPALAVLFFASRKPGKHGEDKEALPWWSFGLFGGLATVWLLTPILGPALGLHTGEGHGEAAPGGPAKWGATLGLALPGVVAGGVLGWFIAHTVNRILGFFFRGFNWVFDWVTRAYGHVIGWSLRLSVIVLVVYVGLVGLTGFGFSRIPTGFIPMQDKGYLVTNIQLPDSASLERTLEVTDAVEKIALETPGVAHTLCLPGMSYVLNANSSSYSNVFIIFKPFHDRRDHELGGDAIANRIRARLAREVPEARVLVFGAPPISGL